MMAQLNNQDLVSAIADGKTVRRINTVQQARNTLREEGLILENTPRGM